MPEMHVVVRWPDGSQHRCYSPSRVVEEFFDAGASYPVAEFLARSRTALAIASERVQRKYGHPCRLAAASLADIERAAARFASRRDACVTVEALER